MSAPAVVRVFMQIICKLIALGLTALTLISPAAAQQKDKLRIAAQVWYPSFPLFTAMDQGIYSKWDLDVEMKVYPSGAPIVQAASTNEWDVAHIGAPPTIQGYKLGLIIAGVISEEAVIHQLIGRPDWVEAAKKDPAKIKGSKVFITTASTGHFMVETCLKKRGLAMSDVQVLPSEQQASLSAFVAGNGDLAQLWTPQTTAARGRGMKVLCDGIEADLKIPSVWVIHPEFAKKNPDAAVRWLRTTLEAVEWAQVDRKRTEVLYKKWDQYRGSQTPDEYLKEEIDLAVDLWPLKRQIEAMKGVDGKKAYVYEALEDIAGFYVRIGRMKESLEQAKVSVNNLVDTTWLDKAAALPAR
jgi:ABC-type nitrate/sulfonate/bicarbonate transport system substrate-binding protein